MVANRFNMFTALYRKQMRELLPEITVVAAVAIVTSVLLYFKIGPLMPAVIIPTFMVMGLAGLLPLISSFRLSQEWNNNTIYLMMSLPVGGSMILGSRLAALLTQYLLGTIIAGLSGLLLTLGLFPEVFSELDPILPYWDRGVLVYLISVAWMAYLMAVSFFSQICGKLVKRASGLVTIVVFAITLWLSGHLFELSWNQIGISIGFGEPSVTFFAALLASAILIAALVFALAVVVYDRRVEL